MTDYINNQFIAQAADYIRDLDWYKGSVLSRAGKMPSPIVANNQHYVQFDKLYALGANIKKSDDRAYPASVETEMASLLRKVKWFTGLVDWTELEHEDYLAGNAYEVENFKQKIDNVNYQRDQDLEKWFVGYNTTFTSDMDYDERWIPWMKLQSTASETPSNPGDMNDKVTNIAGTTGTTAVELDMTTVLTSTSTNMTMDFVNKTFGPIMRAFNIFADTNTGRRMVEWQDQFAGKAVYQCHIHPAVIPELHRAKIYDGEKILATTVAQDMAASGIEIVPNRQFTYALAEEAGGGQGKIQFGFTSNFDRNFKIAVANPMKWEADLEIPGVNTKWVKKYNERLLPFTMPYYDGTNWYKAFFAGYFTYMNDA